MRYYGKKISLDERKNGQTWRTYGQPENIMHLLTLSGGKGMKCHQASRCWSI